MQPTQQIKKRVNRIKELEQLKKDIYLEEKDRKRLDKQLKSLRDPLYQSRLSVNQRMSKPIQKRNFNKVDQNPFLASINSKEDFNNVLSQMNTSRATLSKENQVKGIIGKLQSLKINKNQLQESRQSVSTEMNNLQSKTQNNIIKNELLRLKQERENKSFDLNVLNNLEHKIRDARTTNQQKNQLLEQYEKLLVKQQNKNNSFMSSLQNISSINSIQQQKKIEIAQYSLYVGFICLGLITMLNIVILASKNQRKYLSGITYVVDKVLFGLSFISFYIYMYHLNIRKQITNLNIITITYTLILILMILIHKKKDKETFSEKDKQNFMIVLSIKVALLSFLLLYLFITSRIYKDSESLKEFINVAIIKPVSTNVKNDFVRSITTMITTVIGLVAANAFQYL
jgi:hypothetical protein